MIDLGKWTSGHYVINSPNHDESAEADDLSPAERAIVQRGRPTDD